MSKKKPPYSDTEKPKRDKAPTPLDQSDRAKSGDKPREKGDGETDMGDWVIDDPS